MELSFQNLVLHKTDNLCYNTSYGTQQGEEKTGASGFGAALNLLLAEGEAAGQVLPEELLPEGILPAPGQEGEEEEKLSALLSQTGVFTGQMLTQPQPQIRPQETGETTGTEELTLQGGVTPAGEQVKPEADRAVRLLEQPGGETDPLTAEPGETSGDKSGGRLRVKTEDGAGQEKKLREKTEQELFPQSWRGDGQTVRSMESVRPAAEYPVLRMTDGQESLENLAEAIQRLRSNGGQQLELQLEPASLGKILIRAVYKSGKASVLIACESEQTLRLLSGCAGELGGILKEHTGEQTLVFVEKAPEEQTLGQGDGGRGQQPNRQQQKEEQEKNTGDDFLQQIRLGLLQQT